MSLHSRWPIVLYAAMVAIAIAATVGGLAAWRYSRHAKKDKTPISIEQEDKELITHRQNDKEMITLDQHDPRVLAERERFYGDWINMTGDATIAIRPSDTWEESDDDWWRNSVFRIDPTTCPKQIDWVDNSTRFLRKGIYQFEGENSLRLFEGRHRPTAMTAATTGFIMVDDTTYRILRRDLNSRTSKHHGTQ